MLMFMLKKKILPGTFVDFNFRLLNKYFFKFKSKAVLAGGALL